jgi:hypothetical protein
MSERFGGDFSPDAPPKQPGPLSGKQPQRGRSRANLLILAGLPLLFTSFGDGAVGLATGLAAFGAIALSAYLTREGLEAEEAYYARKIARRPAVPRKIFGAALTGIGVGLATFDTSLGDGILYGIIASGLHLASFGLDPLRDKLTDRVDNFQNDRVARAVDEAEKHLRVMSDAIAKIGDRTLSARLETFQSAAREMFRSVENDPRDLTAARRYLGVYLLGARDATLKFTELYARSRDQSAKTDYVALLDDLEANFTAKTERLLSNSRTELDIEIDVLRDRLQRDGIRLN